MGPGGGQRSEGREEGKKEGRMMKVEEGSLGFDSLGGGGVFKIKDGWLRFKSERGRTEHAGL